MKNTTKKMFIPLMATFIYLLVSVSTAIRDIYAVSTDTISTATATVPSHANDTSIAKLPEAFSMTDLLTPHILLSTTLFLMVFLAIVVYTVKDKPVSSTQASSVHYPPI